MELTFYKPENETLKKYLEGYYFLNAPSKSETIKYLTFPNNYCILAIALNSANIFADNSIKSIPTKNNSVSSSLVYRYIKPIEIVLEPPINEVVFYFKPLGINRFISNFEKIDNKSSFNLNSVGGLEETIKKVLKIKDRKLQIELIENYWLSILVVRDLTILEGVLNDLEVGCSVQKIADKNKISRQHLLKLFYKNIGKPISEFRKIERFRKTLKKEDRNLNLTEKAYVNQYSDQSHFIKHFKGFTSIKPSLFFKEVDTNKSTIWQFS